MKSFYRNKKIKSNCRIKIGVSGFGQAGQSTPTQRSRETSRSDSSQDASNRRVTLLEFSKWAFSPQSNPIQAMCHLSSNISPCSPSCQLVKSTLTRRALTRSPVNTQITKPLLRFVFHVNLPLKYIIFIIKSPRGLSFIHSPSCFEGN